MSGGYQAERRVEAGCCSVYHKNPESTKLVPVDPVGLCLPKSLETIPQHMTKILYLEFDKLDQPCPLELPFHDLSCHPFFLILGVPEERLFGSSLSHAFNSRAMGNL